MIQVLLTVMLILDVFGFLGYILLKDKSIPESISSCSYKLKDPVEFSVWMISIAALLMPVLIGLCKGWYTFLVFFISVFLGMVGSSPLYRTEDKPVHVVGGIGFGILSQVFIILDGYWWITCGIGLVYIVYLLFWKDKNYTWWAELGAIMTLLCYILVRSL